MPTTYEPIATQTLGAPAATITFSSIPATYTDLRFIVTCTTSGSGRIRAQYNGDTATNYSATLLSGTGSTANSSRVTTANHIWLTGGTDTTIPTLGTLDLFSYAGSTYKTSIGTESKDLNGSGVVGRYVQLWQSTSAINSITLFLFSGNYSIGTTATLYGIKNA
jgi:hypothetical protein